MRKPTQSLFGVLAVCTLIPLAPFADASKDDAMITAGRDVYNRCIGCHSPERNRTGPLHCGVVSRMSGSVDGFNYSAAMLDAGVVWTVQTLDRFLESPLKTVPGTTMGFAGIDNDTERKQVIAWLATLTASSPLCEGAPDT